jgi:hypothetical protein
MTNQHGLRCTGRSLQVGSITGIYVLADGAELSPS